MTESTEAPERSALERQLTQGTARRRDYLRQLTEPTDLGVVVETLISNCLRAKTACERWLQRWQISHPGADVAQAQHSARFRDARQYYLGMLDQLADVLQVVYPAPDEAARRGAPTWAAVLLERRQAAATKSAQRPTGAAPQPSTAKGPL